MADIGEMVAALPDKSLLLLDDDAPLRTRLGRALEQRGFAVTLCASVAEAMSALRSQAPAHAVLDMRLEDGTGLKVVEAVRDVRPDAKVIMLTGYGNIATAVQAGKAGAGGYPPQPAAAHDPGPPPPAPGGPPPAPPAKPPSARPRP